ncbi:hypothetical protein HWV62_36705, partial [Athelia sp. TMB]
VTFLAALDLTASATALPSSAIALHPQDFAWIGNAYCIASTAFIPWTSEDAHIFDRRSIFLIGSCSRAARFKALGSSSCSSSMRAVASATGYVTGGALAAANWHSFFLEQYVAEHPIVSFALMTKTAFIGVAATGSLAISALGLLYYQLYTSSLSM